ncbi:MAG TPA: glycosyl hydrolase [Opitutaceae bacterium]|nr:glycosyl hydrolase [Opitutaceae bacterium]
MKFSRRHFLKIGSVAAAGLPFARLSLAREVVSVSTAAANAAAANAAATSADAATATAALADELFAHFREPSGTARPFVRWWWNGGRVVKEELLRELDVLHAAGIGGVEINTIQFPETADPMGVRELSWLSDEWLDMIEVAVTGAKERGLICDIIVGSGWPFGAENLTPAEQTQMLALGTKNLTGPQQYEVAASELLDEVNPPVMSKRAAQTKELVLLRLAPAFMAEFTPGVDLNAKLRDGHITIDVPEGEHVLYFLVKLTGFESVIRGAPGASGPVLNHYSKPAVQAYLDRMSRALTSRLGAHGMGQHFRACFVDSLELEGANWCDDMAAEFARRRGYALEPYLPFILLKTGRMGRALPGTYGAALSPSAQETIDRVRYDFEITKMELFRERFTETFVAWCRKHGVQSRMQAYGREFEPTDAAMTVDLPDCETWIRADVGMGIPEREPKLGRAYSPVNKFVSSGARLAGKRVVTCEEATNTELVFNAALDRLKVTGDQSNLSGVTHSILHGFNYSPLAAPFPGWVRYGTFFNERNPWWPYARRWIDYKARLSALFQNGVLQSEVAVMHPLADLWSRRGAPWDPFPENVLPEYGHNVWEAIHQNGSGCDYVSAAVIQQAKFDGGRMRFGERSYGVLLLLEVETLEPQTAKALLHFAAAGGRLVFVEKVPHRAPGLADHAARNREVVQAIDEVLQEYPRTALVYPAPGADEKLAEWYRRLQDIVGVEPFVKFVRLNSAVNQIHYRCGDRDVFFLANSSLEEACELDATFAANGKTAWLWNPETGERHVYPTAGAPNHLRLSFAPAESKLIVFDRPIEAAPSSESALEVMGGTKEINSISVHGLWRVRLEHVDGTTRSLTLDSLIDFNSREDLRSFAGVIHYETTVEFPASTPVVERHLDLGKVFGVSDVIFNGHRLGAKWYGAHRYDISDAVHPGTNALSIRVTTTLGNYLKSLPNNKDGAKWMKKQPYYPAGLLGPVRVV